MENNTKLIALEELALQFATKEPDWMYEDAAIKLRRFNRRYYVIDEVDASRLEALRKLIVMIIEERRKLAS